MARKLLARLKATSIVQQEKHGYQIIRITKDLGIGADFSELACQIRTILTSGKTKIALSFTPKSYLYTPTLAGLVNLLKIVQEHNGTLSLIKPNKDIVEVLTVMGLSKIIKVVDSENKLADA